MSQRWTGDFGHGESTIGLETGVLTGQWGPSALTLSRADE